MNNIKQYDIVRGSTVAELAREVADAIRDGWQPFGSMSAVAIPAGPIYCQPIVRYEGDE